MHSINKNRLPSRTNSNSKTQARSTGQGSSAEARSNAAPATTDVTHTQAPQELQAASTGAAHEQNPHDLQATVKTADDMQAVLDRFEAERAQGKPVAVISGGSLSGYAVALKLKNLGFNVINAEARNTYTRQNVVGLKEEAVHSLAHLSPDGSLLDSLAESNRISMRKSRIVEKDGTLQQAPSPSHRFADWLMPKQNGNPLPPRIPVREAAPPKQPSFIDANPAAAKKHEPMEHLNLEWPNKEVVTAMDPKDWNYPNMERISEDTVAIGQIRDLEVGLNQHAVKQGIEVAHARVALKDMGSQYSPTFQFGDERVSPKFPVDLVVVAEGKGKNTSVISPQQNVIETGESWYQRNFVVEPGLNSGTSLVGSRTDPDKRPLVPIRINRKDDSLINVAHYARRDETADEVWAKNADRTQATLRAAGSAADANDPSIVEYRSGRIDVNYRRSETTARGNAVLVGDAAGTGSPLAGAGGSLALSIYPEAVERLVKHPGFNDPNTREQANAAYREDADKAVDVWQRKSVDIQRALNLVPTETAQQVNASSGKVKSLKNSVE
ncbi:hypothetical protein [Cystobacter ferrugineus]|uniref:Uncharacterized protein n=1 Tax=Cystobacter ferrugineus TaxID=83449 RepID=A0A1L9AU93_9BACT|nr:hypothetical protein [Cystobacter ferrugineus]OJH33571.1 hypothetical protein BON30_48140 [Cystobacter ferrugineus]